MHTTGRWIERDTLQSEIMLIIITSTQGLVEYKRIFPPSSTELGYVSVCSNWTQPIWYDQLQTTPEGRPRGESPLLELLIEMTEPLCLLQFCTLWMFLQYCYLPTEYWWITGQLDKPRPGLYKLWMNSYIVGPCIYNRNRREPRCFS